MQSIKAKIKQSIKAFFKEMIISEINKPTEADITNLNETKDDKIKKKNNVPNQNQQTQGNNSEISKMLITVIGIIVVSYMAKRIISKLLGIISFVLQNITKQADKSSGNHNNSYSIEDIKMIPSKLTSSQTFGQRLLTALEYVHTGNKSIVELEVKKNINMDWKLMVAFTTCIYMLMKLIAYSIEMGKKTWENLKLASKTKKRRKKTSRQNSIKLNK